MSAEQAAPVFGNYPPSDGRQWDCQCGRCGSSIDWHQCGGCGGEGSTAPGELYDEDPLWYGTDDCETCRTCNGEGSWGQCMSSVGWCEAHPLPGREAVERGAVEWYPLAPATPSLTPDAGEAK